MGGIDTWKSSEILNKLVSQLPASPLEKQPKNLWIFYNAIFMMMFLVGLAKFVK